MDWNLIKTFLAVAETGTLLAAAEALRLSQPTVGRHIDELEAATGLTLFIRGRRGMALTEAGLSLLDDARSMAKEADHFLLRASGRASEASGPVRITASDIVANYLLPPILVALKDAEPGIDIELAPSNAVANLLARDADIAIRMTRPIQNDLIAVKVNDLAMGTYAHERYLAKTGVPETVQDLAGHRLVGYDRDMLILNGMKALGIEGDRSLFTFRTDDQVAYWELVKAGAGVGFGARWLARQTPELRRVLPDLNIPPLPMWLASHQELRTSLKIRRVMDFLREAISAMPLAD
ncbi:LysR family transcriptional regulator [Rhizobium sp. C1]|uniref:LysR family transcriptional regulator n=1 Tax=Rhizobium sp. C1 TaxID=1349799 RepID=UPI001E497A2D|nr:LysR family transcriptional regulator [Rhizobium sp. C1]MCD2178472.1 LysR family transcriptional regulator [Rhizobium sp. C1]